MNMARWPIIRHVRYWWYRWQVNDHYSNWMALGYLPTKDHVDSDEEHLRRIWEGEA